MSTQLTQESERRALAQMAAAGFTPSGLERYKLDRLRELRAVIATLRLEGEQAMLSANSFSGDARPSRRQ